MEKDIFYAFHHAVCSQLTTLELHAVRTNDTYTQMIVSSLRGQSELMGMILNGHQLNIEVDRTQSISTLVDECIRQVILHATSPRGKDRKLINHRLFAMSGSTLSRKEYSRSSNAFSLSGALFDSAAGGDIVGVAAKLGGLEVNIECSMPVGPFKNAIEAFLVECIMNAFKYGSANDPILLSLTDDSGVFEIRCSNSSTGLSGKGSNMGMRSMRMLVENFGGNLKIDASDQYVVMCRFHI